MSKLIRSDQNQFLLRAPLAEKHSHLYNQVIQANSSEIPFIFYQINVPPPDVLLLNKNKGSIHFKICNKQWVARRLALR